MFDLNQSGKAFRRKFEDMAEQTTTFLQHNVVRKSLILSWVDHSRLYGDGYATA